MFCTKRAEVYIQNFTKLTEKYQPHKVLVLAFYLPFKGYLTSFQKTNEFISYQSCNLENLGIFGDFFSSYNENFQINTKEERAVPLTLMFLLLSFGTHQFLLFFG